MPVECLNSPSKNKRNLKKCSDIVNSPSKTGGQNEVKMKLLQNETSAAKKVVKNSLSPAKDEDNNKKRKQKIVLPAVEISTSPAKRKSTTEKPSGPPKNEKPQPNKKRKSENKDKNGEDKNEGGDQSPIAENNVGNTKNNGLNPLDNILNEIDAFNTSNTKPKKKKKREKSQKSVLPPNESPSDIEVGNTPCSSQQILLPLTPFPSAIRPLNKKELARQQHDNSMVQVFLHKDHLMERILAYKMLRGRVESFVVMNAKIDLKSCITPEYEIRPDLVEPVSERIHPKLEVILKQQEQPAALLPLIKSSPKPLAPLPPPPSLFDSIILPPAPPSPIATVLSKAIRGPMTPPGSPGTNHSCSSPPPATNRTRRSGGDEEKNWREEEDEKEGEGGEGRQSLTADVCTSEAIFGEGDDLLPPPPPPPILEKTEQQTSNNNNHEKLLKKFGELLGVHEDRIRDFLGDDLQRLDQLKTDELLSNFRESLIHKTLMKQLMRKETSVKLESQSSKSSLWSVSSNAFQDDEKEEDGDEDNYNNSVDAFEASNNQRSTLVDNQFEQKIPPPPPLLQCANFNNTINNNNNIMSVAMDISSESSSSSSSSSKTSSSSSGVFLPPPPAPPPMPQNPRNRHQSRECYSGFSS